MNKNLYLLRGLPGSGKSTMANMLNATCFEADMYFMRDGEYRFDHTKLKMAHKWCQDSVEDCMNLRYERIAVSNTFTQEWEMQAYYDLAKKHGYTVFSIIVENRHGGQNIHNVPDESIERMRARFETKL